MQQGKKEKARLAKVLDRIPRAIFDAYQTEVQHPGCLVVAESTPDVQFVQRSAKARVEE